MGLKLGYKQTEVGVIPEDWRLATIKEHACIKTGKKNTQDRNKDGAYPFFVRSQTVERINTCSFDGEAVLTAGDGVGTGKVFHYIRGRFDFHQRVYCISDFTSELDGFFFYLYFSTHFFNRIMSMTAKSSVDSVRLEMIAEMLIPLPPFPEQRAIAKALSDVHALLDSLDRLIAKKRDLKQAAMQQLLTGQTRLPGCSGEWALFRVGDLGTFLKGGGIKRDDVCASGVACIRYGELYTRYSGYVERLVSYVDETVALSALPIFTGDLLFARPGETTDDIGVCVAYIGKQPAVAGDDVIVLRTSEHDPVFLASLMNSYVVCKQKSRLGQGDPIAHISAGALSSIEVRIPELREQQAIAQVIVDMDAEIEALEQWLTKTKDLKQAMMQELLTGKTRLVTQGGCDA